MQRFAWSNGPVVDDWALVNRLGPYSVPATRDTECYQPSPGLAPGSRREQEATHARELLASPVTKAHATSRRRLACARTGSPPPSVLVRMPQLLFRCGIHVRVSCLASSHQ
jgi:hypothetical protein